MCPSSPRQLLGFRWAATGAARRWWLGGAGGLDPLKNIALVPAQTAAIRKLEWPGDQVRVLGVGRTRPDGRFCLANEGGKLLDEQNPWQIGRRGHGRQRRSDADGANPSATACATGLVALFDRAGRDESPVRATRDDLGIGVSQANALARAESRGRQRHRTSRVATRG